MKNNHENREIEWLKSFRISDSNDISFDLYKNFSESEESLKNFWETFSDFYYISCAPFKKSIEQWKDIPEIYEILKRSIHMANGFPLEILIGKYSKESMEKAQKITEEKRKEFEWSNIIIWDPKHYVYIVGLFGGSTWRANEEIINDIKKMFPDKIKTIK